MIRTHLSLAFVLVACNLSFAQETSKCPSVQIVGPAGIVAPNEIARYDAIVSPKQTVQLAFEWGISAGTIKTGQGTPQVEVIQPSGTLTATVTVRGLPQGCPATASAASSFEIDPAAQLVIQYTGPLNRKSDMVISALIKKESGSPYDQFYVIVYGNPQWAATKRKIARLKRLFAESLDRATFIQSNTGDNKIEIWRVPPGADPPTPQ